MIIGAVMFSFVNAMVELACPRNCISADLFASGHVVWMVYRLSARGTIKARKMIPVERLLLFWLLQKVPCSKCCSWYSIF